MKIGIILGSTRPNRLGDGIATWVAEVASSRDDGVEYELVDLAEYDLPLLNDPKVPAAANRQYASPATRRWSAKIDEFDAFVFVTAEYNHGIPAAFKNAFDVLYPEWRDKAVTFVGYGADGATRAVEAWRSVVVNAYLYATRGQVPLSLFLDVEAGRFAPIERRAGELNVALDELVRLGRAVGTLRA